jgi:hypothetical protein
MKHRDCTTVVRKLRVLKVTDSQHVYMWEENKEDCTWEKDRPLGIRTIPPFYSRLVMVNPLHQVALAIDIKVPIGSFNSKSRILVLKLHGERTDCNDEVNWAPYQIYHPLPCWLSIVIFL